MKKTYENPMVKKIVATDVIRTSTETPDRDERDNEVHL